MMIENATTENNVAVTQNVEAEKSILGAALQDEEAAKIVSDMTLEEFTDDRYKQIAGVIGQLVREHEPVSIVTVYSKISSFAGMDPVGASVVMELLSGMRDFCVTPCLAKSYRKIIEECYRRRQLCSIGKALMETAVDATQDIEEIRSLFSEKIKGVSSADSLGMITQIEALKGTYKALEDAQMQDGKTRRILTGITRLDEMTGGLYGSKLVVIGARPSVGKSVFALSICVDAAKQGKRILFISLEMTAEEIIEREFADEGSVSLSEITSENISADGWNKIDFAMGILSKCDIVYDSEADTVPKIRKAASYMLEHGGLDLVCVDYMQLIEGAYTKTRSRYEQVSEISRNLKKMAQDFSIPVIVLTQLNREGEQTKQAAKRAPKMSDARDSGSIEQDANIFILLHEPDESDALLASKDRRETYKRLKEQGQKLIHVNVEKNRQGVTGSFFLAFDGKYMRYLPIKRPVSVMN